MNSWNKQRMQFKTNNKKNVTEYKENFPDN